MNAIVPPPMSPGRAVRHLCAIDLERFRCRVSGVFGVELVRATLVESAIHFTSATSTPLYGQSGADMFLPLLDLAIVLATAIGTAMLVQADHPTDDRAFWRTRPIPPLVVALAKLLALTLLFVVVPAALNGVRLLAYGAPISALASATLQIAVLAGLVIVPAWFFAIVTRTLPRFLGAMLGVIIVGYFVLGTLTTILAPLLRTSLGLFSGVVPVVFDWQHTALHGWWGGLLSTLVGLMILVAHYEGRRTKTTVAALLFLVLIPSLVPPASIERAAPKDLTTLVDGRLTVPDRLSAMSFTSHAAGQATARVSGTIASPPLPRDVSATVRVDRIRVRALGRGVPAEGTTQCCLGAGAIGVAVSPGVPAPRVPLPMIPSGNTLFLVPASQVDPLRSGALDLDADATVTFYRHRLVGTIPLQPGASLRTDGSLLQILSLNEMGQFIRVDVRFARFPSMAGSSPRLDLFKVDAGRYNAWLAWAPWPIATYNEGTTVDNWSRGRTWVGHFSFTIDRQEPLPPAARLAVVETVDIGTAHTHLAKTGVPITVAQVSGMPAWIH